MGYLGIRDFEDFSSAISSSLPHGILLFVGLDVDSLCACRILTELLKLDFIPFRIVPVVTVSDVTRANESFFLANVDEQVPRTIIMINCAGLLDVSEIMGLDEDELTTIYIIDSHRPLNLYNVFGSERIYVIDDGDIESHENDYLKAFEYLQQQDEEDEDDSDNESIDSLDLDPSKSVIANAQIPYNELGKKDKRKRKAAYEESWKHYCTGLYKSTPCAYLMWCMTSVTEAYLSFSMNEEKYLFLYDTLKNEISKYNNFVESNAELDKENTFMSTERLELFKEDNIEAKRELKFFLMRHWTLYESMMYSSFLITRLRTWNEKGKMKLDLMLSKIGIPLSICKGPFGLIEKEIQNDFTDKFEKYSEEFRVTEFEFDSFIRRYGMKLTVSASDMVYALYALLDPISTDNLSLFYSAYDALDSNNHSILIKGLDMAKEVQRFLVEQGNSIILNKRITPLKSFYLAMMNNANSSWLKKPNVLKQLAVHLMTALKETGRDVTNPFVVAAKDDTSRILTSVSFDKNKTVNAFQKTAQDLKCSIEELDIIKT
ncbi:CDC45-like protein, partial [Rozella allomycis CSF55]